ncbi:hypothetical protein B0H67DRAFT_649820 [Lasiosphaeris hirsuta]|uniref:Indole-diterpene biosynthesis protein PaxU n=1 Tax=Lasiosphaeris hirsuta TaxID=260670 RepID=A0AA39ZXJ6_9PEZI|nr:hypothetical protein B0H67DRAFT_649820 [Lasiosphaeris hirsuta]
MASNTPTTAPASPLAFMTKLNQDIYLFRPDSAAPPAAAGAPQLILLTSWMGARDAHIAKYLAPYRALALQGRAGHPRSPNPPVHLPPLSPPSSSPSPSPSPSSSDTPQLLIHLFSNGGSTTLAHLRTLTPLPSHTLVYDSAPGQFTYTGSFAALTAGLSGWTRAAFAPLVHAFCAWYWLVHNVFARGAGGPFAAVAAAHNEREGRARAEVRRAYVYSEEDKLVDWRDVERHAADAKSGGFVVRVEKFAGSAHVAHARRDEGRYWGVVRETWEGW